MHDAAASEAPSSDQSMTNSVEHQPWLERVGLTSRYRPSADHVVLQVLAVIVAVGGIVQNSAAVVIGAMLLAPVMTPVLSLSAAIVLGRAVDAARLVAWISLLVLGSILLGWGLGSLLPTVDLTDELLTRTSPDLTDLVIALAAGTAGAFALTRDGRSSALPGVAVAVALVPPMAAAGLAAAAGRGELARGAALLVGTNLAAIVAMGVVVFVGTGVVSAASLRANSGSILASMCAFAVVLIAVAIPLSGQSVAALATAREQTEVDIQIRDWLGMSGTRIVDVSIEKGRITIQLAGPNPPPPSEPLEMSIEAAGLGNRPLEIRWVQERGQEQREDSPSPTISTTDATRLVVAWLAQLETDIELVGLTIEETTLGLALRGGESPPDTTSLLELFEASFAVRPSVNLNWQQGSGSDETVPDVALPLPPVASEPEQRTNPEDAGPVPPLANAESGPNPDRPVVDAFAIFEQAVVSFNEGDRAALRLLIDEPDELSQVVQLRAIRDPAPTGEDPLQFILLQERTGGSLRLRRIDLERQDGGELSASVRPLEPEALDVRNPRAVVTFYLDAIADGDARARGVLARPQDSPAGGISDIDDVDEIGGEASATTPLRVLDFGVTRRSTTERGPSAEVPVLGSIPSDGARFLRCDRLTLLRFGETDAWLIDQHERGEAQPQPPGSPRFSQVCRGL